MPDSFLIDSLRAQLRFSKRPPRLRRAPRWLPPDAAERAYRRHVRSIVDVVEAAVADLILPRLPRLIAEAAALRKDSATRADAWADEMGNLSGQVRRKIDERTRDEKQVAGELSAQVNAWNAGQWKKSIRVVLGVDLHASEPWVRSQLKSWATENASLIKTLEDDAVHRVAVWTNKGLREGARYEEIADKIAGSLRTSRAKADFLARDQTAKLNADLTQRRQEQVGITEYEWITAQDERVRGLPSGTYPKARPRHDTLNGKTCRWDDPGVFKKGGKWVSRDAIDAVKLHPGKDYQCRCGAIPKLDHLLEGLK